MGTCQFIFESFNFIFAQTIIGYRTQNNAWYRINGLSGINYNCGTISLVANVSNIIGGDDCFVDSTIKCNDTFGIHCTYNSNGNGQAYCDSNSSSSKYVCIAYYTAAPTLIPSYELSHEPSHEPTDEPTGNPTAHSSNPPNGLSTSTSTTEALPKSTLITHIPTIFPTRTNTNHTVAAVNSTLPVNVTVKMNVSSTAHVSNVPSTTGDDTDEKDGSKLTDLLTQNWTGMYFFSIFSTVLICLSYN